MKKFLVIFFGILLLSFLFRETYLYGRLYRTYIAYKLTHQSYTHYVECEHIMNEASSDKSSFNENIQKYMTEQVYNNLSPKTKSYYDPADPSKSDTLVKVINQKLDPDDKRIIYVDFMVFSHIMKDIPGWTIGINQAVVLNEDEHWKIAKYIAPVSPDWYIPNIVSFSYWYWEK